MKRSKNFLILTCLLLMPFAANAQSLQNQIRTEINSVSNDIRSGSHAGSFNYRTANAVEMVAASNPSLAITWTPAFIYPNNHSLQNITVTNSLSGGSSPSVFLLSVVSNEPDAGTGGGDVPNDIQGATTGVNTTSFQLRSETSPDAPYGTGRYYTVTYRVIDGAYLRDTTFAIPVLRSPGRVDPFMNTAAATGSVKLDVAPSPNPVITTGTIQYTLSGGPAAQVLLVISNNVGKWVRNLDQGLKAPGTYTLTFDGNAADGTPLPNGVYPYQLTVGAPYNSLNTGVIIINRFGGGGGGGG